MTTDRMTREQLATFCESARRLFRGETDQELFRLALPRVAALRADDATAALEEYAVTWGGARARFIPGKFFEFVSTISSRSSETREREARLRRCDEIALARDAMATAVSSEWSTLRREIETANPLVVGEHVAYLRSVGWGSPPPAFADWSRSWVVAVSDLLAGRSCPARDEETGEWSRRIAAREFYARSRAV